VCRPSPVRGEQWRRGLSQTEAPEPGQEAGTSIIGAPIFDRLAAPVAPNVRGHGIGLVGGLSAIGCITLETEHEGYLRWGPLARVEHSCPYSSKALPFSRSGRPGTAQGDELTLSYCHIADY